MLKFVDVCLFNSPVHSEQHRNSNLLLAYEHEFDQIFLLESTVKTNSTTYIWAFWFFHSQKIMDFVFSFCRPTTDFMSSFQPEIERISSKYRIQYQVGFNQLSNRYRQLQLYTCFKYYIQRYISIDALPHCSNSKVCIRQCWLISKGIHAAGTGTRGWL